MTRRSFLSPSRISDTGGEIRMERRGRARKGAEGRAGVREAVRGGGFLLGRRRRGSRGRDSVHIAI